MHFIQTPWLAVQFSGKFFDKKLRVPPRLTLGLGNEYFCRPQPALKKAKLKMNIFAALSQPSKRQN
jgi:hypothetical protein